ncbi:MAG: hypothetical protein RL168_670, partial [Bacteroidota bacterium]
MPVTRIVFFGTPEFASATLEALAKDPTLEVVAVVTAPDKPAGRGQTLRASHVSDTGHSLGIPVLKPVKLKDPEFVQTLKGLQADVFIVVAFRMLPMEVWNMPSMGTFNVHASLLPDYRGAAPIQWAVANGDTQTGVTTFLLNDRIDEGAILLQDSLDIAPNETISSVYARLMHAGAELAVRTVHALRAKNCQPTPQNLSENARLAPKIFADFAELERLSSLDLIHHRIRACDSYPGASLALEEAPEERIKVFGSKLLKFNKLTDYTLCIELII